MLIFKIIPRLDWAQAGEHYAGSAHDRADGFLHSRPARNWRKRCAATMRAKTI
jgi:uncharacterized protein (DUF952 family)